MKKVALLLLLTVSVFSCARVFGQGGIITTIAGIGVNGFSGDGGPATDATFGATEILGMAIDDNGNIYISDNDNRRIRKINNLGVITTIAGFGSGWCFSCGDGGPATDADLVLPEGIALDKIGNLYITESFGNRIRKIDTFGIITTFAGNSSTTDTGDGGPATAAGLHDPQGICIDTSGNVYVSVPRGIRKINTSGIITTVVGNGTLGYSGDGGPATDAALSEPTSIAFDAIGNLIIMDYGNARVRKVNLSGIISTIAGNGIMGFSGDGGRQPTLH